MALVLLQSRDALMRRARAKPTVDLWSVQAVPTGTSTCVHQKNTYSVLHLVAKAVRMTSPPSTPGTCESVLSAGRIVGYGGYGIVTEYCAPDGSSVVLKCIRSGEIADDRFDAHEVKLLRKNLHLPQMVPARLVRESVRHGEDTDLDTWTVVAMQTCSGTVFDFANVCTAEEVFLIVEAILDLAEGMFKAGYAWVDGKVNNVLYTTEGKRGIRVVLGDWGGVCSVGSKAGFAVTYPYPWDSVHHARGTEAHVAWAVAHIALELFLERFTRFTRGERKTATSFITYDYNAKGKRPSTLHGLHEMLGMLNSLEVDLEERAVRDFFLDVCSYSMWGRMASSNKFTFDGVRTALREANVKAALRELFNLDQQLKKQRTA